MERLSRCLSRAMQTPRRDTWPRDRFLEGVIYELKEKLVSLGQEIVVGGGTSPGEAACGVRSGR